MIQMDGLDTGNIALDGHRKRGEPGERTAVKGGARPWRPHWRASMKRHGRNSQSEALVDISPAVLCGLLVGEEMARGGRDLDVSKSKFGVHVPRLREPM